MEVEHDLVEAYFETNGFLIRQAQNIESGKFRKKQESLPTLTIFNPLVECNSTTSSFRLYTSDLRKIRYGLVCLLGWGNSGFSNGMLNNDSMLIKFYKKEFKDKRIETAFNCTPKNEQGGMGSLLKLLIVPALPRSETKIGEIFTLLQNIQVDGVLTLRSILENLLKQTDSGVSILSKPVFQVLNLLKAYELAKEPQLEMF